jgi:hypothetical protein
MFFLQFLIFVIDIVASCGLELILMSLFIELVLDFGQLLLRLSILGSLNEVWVQT